MAHDDNAQGPAELNTIPLSLKSATIEKIFTDCVMDLEHMLVLDEIDIEPDGFRVRCHDLYGQLPEVTIKNSGDISQDKERLGNEACKLLAIARLRREMAQFLPGSRFLLPTSIAGRAVVGLQARQKTWIAEGKDFLEAYHELRSQVAGLIQFGKRPALPEDM